MNDRHRKLFFPEFSVSLKLIGDVVEVPGEGVIQIPALLSQPHAVTEGKIFARNCGQEVRLRQAGRTDFSRGVPAQEIRPEEA
jgi:hypothetical protein